MLYRPPEQAVTQCSVPMGDPKHHTRLGIPGARGEAQDTRGPLAEQQNISVPIISIYVMVCCHVIVQLSGAEAQLREQFHT